MDHIKRQLSECYHVVNIYPLCLKRMMCLSHVSSVSSKLVWTSDSSDNQTGLDIRIIRQWSKPSGHYWAFLTLWGPKKWNCINNNHVLLVPIPVIVPILVPMSIHLARTSSGNITNSNKSTNTSISTNTSSSTFLYRYQSGANRSGQRIHHTIKGAIGPLSFDNLSAPAAPTLTFEGPKD